jgi:glycosyltransferase involved in cell wall biosynthesis
MILLTHPTGNANVRAVLDSLDQAGMLARFVTTVGWSKSSYPFLSDKIHGKLRRNYALPADKMDVHPLRESVRLLAGPLRAGWLTTHERGWASMDKVLQSLDRHAARSLRHGKYGPDVRAVYAYEDCALGLFEAARDLGLRRIYELPIAYWETARRLLREEAERYPDWEPTLGGTRDSEEKFARKTHELELAELVICPSNFVLESLPGVVRGKKRCVMAAFGSPEVCPEEQIERSTDRPLRVLFAGAMTQRKGLADVFAAMKMLNSNDAQLVVMGSLLRPLSWYQERSPNFVYEPPRAHREFLELMQTCDLLVLPSIVEGRALVQQEAMACGLPVIATRNAGADDLIVNGETGFLVPIRSPEVIAEKIEWCVRNRSDVGRMGVAAQKRARELTWRSYGETILRAIRSFTGSP